MGKKKITKTIGRNQQRASRRGRRVIAALAISGTVFLGGGVRVGGPVIVSGHDVYVSAARSHVNG